MKCKTTKNSQLTFILQAFTLFIQHAHRMLLWQTMLFCSFCTTTTTLIFYIIPAEESTKKTKNTKNRKKDKNVLVVKKYCSPGISWTGIWRKNNYFLFPTVLCYVSPSFVFFDLCKIKKLSRVEPRRWKRRKKKYDTYICKQ